MRLYIVKLVKYWHRWATASLDKGIKASFRRISKVNLKKTIVVFNALKGRLK